MQPSRFVPLRCWLPALRLARGGCFGARGVFQWRRRAHSAAADKCMPPQFQAPNHVPGPGVLVSKVLGNARPNSSASPLLLVPQSLQGLTGTPLVAGSPIRHESAVQGSAVEVQTYQPPWKALSEFALQSDLDQPAFQQLVRTCSALPEGWTPGEVGWI